MSKLSVLRNRLSRGSAWSIAKMWCWCGQSCSAYDAGWLCEASQLTIRLSGFSCRGCFEQGFYPASSFASPALSGHHTDIIKLA